MTERVFNFQHRPPNNKVSNWCSITEESLKGMGKLADSKRIIRIVREDFGRLSHYKPPLPLMATGTQWSVNHKLTTGKKNIQAARTVVSLNHLDLFVIKISCIRQLPKMSCCTHIRKQQDSQFSHLKSNSNKTKSPPNNIIVFLSHLHQS